MENPQVSWARGTGTHCSATDVDPLLAITGASFGKQAIADAAHSSGRHERQQRMPDRISRRTLFLVSRAMRSCIVHRESYRPTSRSRDIDFFRVIFRVIRSREIYLKEKLTHLLVMCHTGMGESAKRDANGRNKKEWYNDRATS